jgi:hypothetical protein
MKKFRKSSKSRLKKRISKSKVKRRLRKSSKSKVKRRLRKSSKSKVKRRLRKSSKSKDFRGLTDDIIDYSDEIGLKNMFTTILKTDESSSVKEPESKYTKTIKFLKSLLKNVGFATFLTLILSTKPAIAVILLNSLNTELKKIPLRLIQEIPYEDSEVYKKLSKWFEENIKSYQTYKDLEKTYVRKILPYQLYIYESSETSKDSIKKNEDELNSIFNRYFNGTNQEKVPIEVEKQILKLIVKLPYKKEKEYKDRFINMNRRLSKGLCKKNFCEISKEEIVYLKKFLDKDLENKQILKELENYIDTLDYKFQKKYKYKNKYTKIKNHLNKIINEEQMLILKELIVYLENNKSNIDENYINDIINTLDYEYKELLIKYLEGKKT